MENVVVYKLLGKKEQRKPFSDFISALQYQGDLLRKKKKLLEYAKVVWFLKDIKKLGLLIQVPIFFATFAANNLNNLDYGKEIH